MTYDEMNRFIERYLTNNKSGTALMLSGGWGTGKSFYIKNKLVSYLEKKKIGCVIVSLYGLTEVSEIYKNIYIDLRMKHLEGKAGEFVTTGRAVLKGVVNSVLLFNSINFEIKEEDLKKIYESVELENRLVILEDLERTKIPVEEVLGMVNELVENNGAKVLLVANESLIYIPDSESDNNLDSKKNKYFKIKEKTIGDTVTLSGFEKEAIKKIVELYKKDSGILNDVLNDKKIADETEHIFLYYYKGNLRTLKYALQKIVELFNYYGLYSKECDRLEFYKYIYIQTLYYVSTKQSDENSEVQDGGNYYGNMPLPRIVCEYIHDNINIDEEIIKQSFTLYDEFMFFLKDYGDDKDFKIIENFENETEQNVLLAFGHIEERLNKKEFGIVAYEMLLRYFLQVAPIVGFNSDAAIDKMVDNIKGTNRKIDVYNYLNKGFYKETNPEHKEYFDVVHRIENAIEIGKGNGEFSYKEEDILSLQNHMIDPYSHAYVGKSFISKYNIEKMHKMIIAKVNIKM